MQRITIIIILAILPIIGHCNPDHESLRASVFELNFDSRKADSIYKKLKSIENKSALQIAYQGATAAHLAKICNNPLRKFWYVHHAIELMDSAISKKPTNLEIRFMRFALQVQLPDLLNSKFKIAKDRNYLTANYQSYEWTNLEFPIRSYILDFLADQQVIPTDFSLRLK